MNNVFADTNLFLRVLVPNDLEQTAASLRIFHRAAAGEFVLRTNVMVIAEIVWVLLSTYQASRQTVYEGIMGIINTPGVEVEQAITITQALDIFLHTNMDFIDAYSMSWMQVHGLSVAYTFDRRHFSRVPGIEVKVPE